jgi:streptogramin lyase
MGQDVPMIAGIPSIRRRRVALAGAVLTMALALAACVPPSTFPDGSVPQIRPIGTNGLAFDGTDLWVCDLFGGQLLRLDPVTGRILERIGPDQGIDPPDDLVIAPDGSIVYTSPGTGVVGRVRRTGPLAGRVTKLAQLPAGVNPIALTPDGTAVVVGYGSGDTDRIDRIDLATGVVTVVAVGVPGLNGFSFGPDGGLWAPIGGPLAALTGDAGIVRIDIDNGVVARLPLTFPGEPDKRGIQLGASAKWTPDGRLMVVQGIGAALYQVDPSTGETTRYSTIGTDFGDNEVALADGRIFVSGFFGSLSVVDAAGHSTPVDIGG